MAMSVLGLLMLVQIIRKDTGSAGAILIENESLALLQLTINIKQRYNIN